MTHKIFPEAATDDEGLFKKIVKRLDWGLIFGVFVLAGIGIMAIYSAAGRYGNSWEYLHRQMVALSVGLIGMIFLIFVSYQVFNTYSYYIYALTVIMLVGVLMFGTSVRGTRGWFDIKVFYFQPAEITKIGMVLAIAGYIDRHSKLIKYLRGWMMPIGLALGHIVLILLQPDFSSILVIMPMVLVLMYVAGARILHISAFILLGIMSFGVPLASTYLNLSIGHAKGEASKALLWMQKAFAGSFETIQMLIVICICLIAIWWFFRRWRVFIPGFYLICTMGLIMGGMGSSLIIKKGLKEYQRQRLVAFINPELDPLGAGYNILQSKIAVGSGGLFGRGYLSGTQSQLGFLPEQHTDFIFSVIGEEFGFFRSLLVLGLYFWIIWRSVGIAASARDRFGKLTATGIATIFVFYGIVNIGMTMGMMPITGLPLPFVSYGGSSLVSSMFAIGILLSIHIRRFVL